MTNVLLVASASAALYKACDLASKLTQASFAVRVVLTPRAAQLVAPQAFEAVTGEPVWGDEFGEQRRGAMDHIDLGDWADVCVVAPATADLISRLATGIANDLASTVPLVLRPGVPKLVAPAMNPRMWDAAPIQRNVATLAADGWSVLQPGVGHMACGDEGRGRLSEPADIVAAVREAIA